MSKSLNTNTFPIMDLTVETVELENNKKAEEIKTVSAVIIHNNVVTDSRFSKTVGVDGTIEQIFKDYNLWLSLMNRKYETSINCWAAWADFVKYKLLDTCRTHNLNEKTTLQFMNRHEFFSVSKLFIGKYATPKIIQGKLNRLKKMVKQGTDRDEAKKQLKIPPKKITLSSVLHYHGLEKQDDQLQNIANVLIHSKIRLQKSRPAQFYKKKVA